MFQKQILRPALFGLMITPMSGLQATPITLVPYSQQWRFMHPVNGLPVGSGATEPNSGTVKWYAPEIEFNFGYTGPEFGAGIRKNGVPATVGTYDSGVGAGPIGYDTAWDYLTATTVSLPRPFSAISTLLTQPLSGNRRTAYFRTTFTVPAGGVDSLTMSYLIDDGAFVYLDGELITRINIGSLGGTTVVPDTYTTAAANASATEDQLRTLALGLSAGAVDGAGNASNPAVGNATVVKAVVRLSEGPHTLAVSCHNQAFDSTDLTMALQLSAQTIELGSLDPVVNHNLVANFGAIYAMASQPDGKMIVTGAFEALGSQTSAAIARLNADGTLDNTWLSAGVSYTVAPSIKTVAVQEDGKILIGGQFNALNGEPRNNVARLNQDGSTDFSFDPGIGADSEVRAICILPNGKILLGGGFTHFNGAALNHLVMLNADGSSTMAGFTPPLGFYDGVQNIISDKNGTLWVSGNIYAEPGGSNYVRNIVRIQSNGTLDTSYNYNQGGGDPKCNMLQPDGRMLIGGMNSWHSINRRGITRLTDLAALESTATFNGGTGTTGFLEAVNSLCLQADGKIIGAGDFTVFSGLTQSGLIRLNSNGAVDSTISPALDLGASPDVRIVGLQADGQVWLGGFFGSIRGQSRDGLARIRNSSGSDRIAIPTPGTIRWLRDGAVPEAQWVRMELSTDLGLTWANLGLATHVTGGWEMTGLTLPATGSIRCRGRVQTHGSNGMGSGLIQSVQAYGPGSALASWRAQRFGISAASAAALDMADADKDGMPNFMEFALGTDPTVNDRMLQGISVQSTGLKYEYLRNPAAVPDGMTFIVEWSDALTSNTWSSAGVTMATVLDSNLERVTASIPKSVTGHRFARLRILK